MRRELTEEQWLVEGEELFGTNRMAWQFVCPACGHIATPMDWMTVGAKNGQIAFSCIGRFLKTCKKAFCEPEKSGPCDYAGGGLIGLNPVTIHFQNGCIAHFFDFNKPLIKGD